MYESTIKVKDLKGDNIFSLEAMNVTLSLADVVCANRVTIKIIDYIFRVHVSYFIIHCSRTVNCVRVEIPVTRFLGVTGRIDSSKRTWKQCMSNEHTN